jgi:uncharacterized membrane protein
MSDDQLQFHRDHENLHATFGSDRFGVRAERLARFFGTPRYIVAQTVVVLIWIAYNGWVALHYLSTKAFDPYPFILLNLAFSTQAAYAAPLILLAQTRQAARDKAMEKADAAHRELLSERSLQQGREIQELLRANTELTQAVHDLTEKIHRLVSEPRS